MKCLNSKIPGLATAIFCALFLAGALLQLAPAKSWLPVVVELYNSQGCNSCPPADKLLGRLAKRDDVIALTFNVGYWDYLGWMDTLADPANTKRQRQYASSMGDLNVYTPQMVIGGRQHVVGSNSAAVAAAIEAEQRQNTGGPNLYTEHLDGQVKISIGATSKKGTNATVWLVRYDHRRNVPIERGETAGSYLSYFNVVRNMRPLGQWRGKSMEMNLSRAELSERGRDGCAIIVQQYTGGPILAAARMDF